MYKTNVANTISTVAKRAELMYRASPTDYTKDGLIYCGLCNTPKQARLSDRSSDPNVLNPSVSNNEYNDFISKLGFDTVFCLCKCQSEARDNAEANEKRNAVLNRMREKAFYNYQMRDFTFSNDRGGNPELAKVALSYAQSFSSIKSKPINGLILCGSPGTGKTFFAACIVNYLVDRNISCYFTSIPRIVNVLDGMREGKQEYVDALNQYELLVLDDFGTQRDSGYMNEWVFNIINSRAESKKPLIVTTNLWKNDLKSTSDIGIARVYSRLLGMCFPYDAKGGDVRKKTLSENYESFQKQLGLDIT